MFTGIITHQTAILKKEQGVFTLQKPQDTVLHLGQSIAHDGACMTVTEVMEATYSFFAMEESFRKTNFGTKIVGDFFNLEFCVQASSMLDGHIVTGHIDTTGTVIETVVATDGSKMIQVQYDSFRDKNVIAKGSIAVNGVSLTVVDVGFGRCTLRLIPLTQTVTNLGSLTPGDIVNIEFDMLGKYVLNYLNKQHNSA